MKIWIIGVAVLGFLPGLALAEAQSETLFKHKHWEVEVVSFDDDTLACLAEVDATSESFSIWVYPDGAVKLQFYSTAWEFGEGETANLDVKIDSRSPWTLTNAELYKNSVLFNLPNGDDGVRFLVEVASGTRLYLRSEAGDEVQNYSLAGSRASMDALAKCGEMITGPSNPFN